MSWRQIGFVLPMSVGAILRSLSTVVVALNAQLLRRLDRRPETTTSAIPSGGTRKDPVMSTTVDDSAEHTPEAHHGYISDKARYLTRLKRIEGQARGISRMVEDEKYCIDILTQISAITSALESVALGLLDDHLKHCVVDAAKLGGPDADVKLKEASDAIARLVRS